ncbi:MAG: hypothetical protein JO340_14890 [Acidobacteriaceae bacterium]|nr:hypothetical protein [Acidobacteriaceae bacterium]
MAVQPLESPRLLLAVLALIACPFAQGREDPPPSSAEQQRILDAIQDYADQYLANLPNFICDQVTHQYHAGRNPTRWRQGDVLTSKLVYAEGHEQRSLELVNQKPIRPGMRLRRMPLETQGEFGVLMASIFSPASHTSIEWKGWESVRGSRAAVFAFAIDAQHSTMSLTSDDLIKDTVPFHGTVYGDPKTGAIWRITDIETNLPRELHTKLISRVVDYGGVTIAAKTYLLPLQATIWLTSDSGNVRNELEFLNYRKFEAESVIKFASSDSPAPQP